METEFNKYFPTVGTALASNIPIDAKDGSQYLPKLIVSMENKERLFRNLEKHSRRRNETKGIGCANLNGNIIIDVYNSKRILLFKTIKLSLEEAVFP